MPMKNNTVQKEIYEKSFFMTNNGCIRRKIDAQHILDFLLINGYKKVDEQENADLIFFVSCAADNASEAIAINAIYDLGKRKHKQGKIYVIGCLSKINPKALKEIEGLTCMIGPTEMNQLDSFFPNMEYPFKGIREPYIVSKEIFTQQGLNFFRDDYSKEIKGNSVLTDNLNTNKTELQYELFKSKSNIVRIARGCLSSCKYCCIHKATGRLVSQPMNKIYEQFRSILAVSSPNFTLTAEDTGAYGQDIGTNFPKLLRGIAEIDDNIKLAANAFNPRWIIPILDEFEKALGETHMLKHVVAPIQSGSDYILSKMGRGHTIDDGRRFFCVLEKFTKELQVHTHLIIGFPGERPSDVDDTIKFMRRFPQINYYIYPYNDRPGTVSSKYANKLSEDEIQNRLNLTMEVKRELMNAN